MSEVLSNFNCNHIPEGDSCGLVVTLVEQNAKLRELVSDMWHDGMCECDERGACAECEYHFPDRMRELGIEATS